MSTSPSDTRRHVELKHLKPTICNSFIIASFKGEALIQDAAGHQSEVTKSRAGEYTELWDNI